MISAYPLDEHTSTRRAARVVKPRAGQFASCTAQHCDYPLFACGLCERHYRRLWRTGDTEMELQERPSECTLEWCHDPVHAKGLCPKHHMRRWRRMRLETENAE